MLKSVSGKQLFSVENMKFHVFMLVVIAQAHWVGGNDSKTRDFSFLTNQRQCVPIPRDLRLCHGIGYDT